MTEIYIISVIFLLFCMACLIYIYIVHFNENKDTRNNKIINTGCQSVTIPKYVADWIDYCKENHLTLTEAFSPVSEHRVEFTKTYKGDTYRSIRWALNNQDIFSRAWLDGYEIRKEKLYTVEIPNPNRTDVSLVLGLYNDGKVAIFAVCTDSWKYEKQHKLTETEIKEDFDWAWQFAEEVKK